mgnify:CR=1 FL=1
MKVKITKDDIFDKYHYRFGEVYDVIPYRHNSIQYWEVIDSTLTEEQRNRCTFIDYKNEKIFWILKSHTIKYDVFIEELPEELFNI